MPNVNKVKAIPYDHRCQPGSMVRSTQTDKPGAFRCSVCGNAWDYDKSNPDHFKRWRQVA